MALSALAFKVFWAYIKRWIGAIPVWAVALALLIGLGYWWGERARAQGHAAGAAEVQARFDKARIEWDGEKLRAALASKQAEADARAEERRTATAQLEIIRDAHTAQVQRLQVDAAAARVAGDRLREHVTALAARASEAARDPAAAGGGAAAGDSALLLAELQRRADARAGELARIADERGIAGEACERSYKSLTPALDGASSVVPSLGIDIGGVGFFGGIKVPKVLPLLIDSDARTERLGHFSSEKVNSEREVLRAVSRPLPHVLHVGLLAHVTKVREPVVELVGVDVVDYPGRPSASHVEPREPVGPVGSINDAYGQVSIADSAGSFSGIPRAPYGVASAVLKVDGWSGLPVENAGLRVVGKKFFEPRASKIESSHEAPVLLIGQRPVATGTRYGPRYFALDENTVQSVQLGETDATGGLSARGGVGLHPSSKGTNIRATEFPGVVLRPPATAPPFNEGTP